MHLERTFSCSRSAAHAHYHGFQTPLLNSCPIHLVLFALCFVCLRVHTPTIFCIVNVCLTIQLYYICVIPPGLHSECVVPPRVLNVSAQKIYPRIGLFGAHKTVLTARKCDGNRESYTPCIRRPQVQHSHRPHDEREGAHGARSLRELWRAARGHLRTSEITLAITAWILIVDRDPTYWCALGSLRQLLEAVCRYTI